ncbi:MAG: C25 family cysteine peptidase [Candidatus Sulfotelmatobacter sp.]
MTNSGIPSPVTAGNNITYTQVVTNSGPSNCSTATFNEATPANTTFVSVAAVTTGGGAWTCPNASPVSCTNPSVPPGSTATITAVYNVPTGTASGTIITDTATVATASRDTSSSNNSATVTIGVAGATQADLSVTNAASPNPVNAGQNITYTQTVTNNGPATAGGTAVTLSDQVPANTTYVSQSGPAGWTCGVFSSPYYTCSIASLAANASATFTFVVSVNATAATGSIIAQTDSVSASPTSDPNPNNNSATASVAVADSADLSVTNSSSPVPVIAGNNITYAQVVTNAGPSTAIAATFTESTPANTTFVQLTPIPTGWSCTLPASGSAGTITCTNPSFATGAASFPVVVKVTAGTLAGTAISDTATISSSTSDPNSTNNTATASDVVATATQADLITTNTASPTSVAAGSNVVYTQSVTNNGPAAATSVTFTQTTPPNTNFQSMVIPSGWSCSTPAVGAAGTITCTDATLAVNGTGGFTITLQVNAGTASGTSIAETATATASNIVPNLTSNTATAVVVVANASSATVTIAKSATPSPMVPSGVTLTYTLAIGNSGPSTATNVIVTDPLPTDIEYLSVNTNVGTCSEADGTVSCLLGTMTNGATATITILTLAGAPGIATNTASVIDDQMTSPNTSTQVETITAATSIKLESFIAQVGRNRNGTSRAVLLWKTGAEMHNLGFNVYREQNGERVRLNPSLIAGSALLMSGALPKHAGKTYTWIDSSVGAGSAAYWLEDLDVNGTRVLHGPTSAIPGASPQFAANTATSSPTLNQLSPESASTPSEASHRVENNASGNTLPTFAQHQKQFAIAGYPAVKIFVKHEGWYCVTQPELVAAGLDPNVDPALLHLYAEAIEQPIQITGVSGGPGGFGPQAALYFYGTGIDTQESGTRVYFLTTEQTPGERIQQLPPSTGSNQPPASFPFTVELTPHTTYFSALTTAKGNNFFGPLISSVSVDETIQVSGLDSSSTEPAQFDVLLQGVILAVPHDVTITLNGSTLGNLTFTGQGKGKFHVSLPPGVLQEGVNTVTFTSQDGEYDYSLVQSIRITYQHLYAADSDELIFTGRPGDELKLSSFSQPSVAVLDITDPAQPVQLTPQVTAVPNSKTSDYMVEVQVPWNSTGYAGPALHTLMAVADTQVASAAGIRQNHPSHWHSAQRGSEIVMVSAEAFAGALGTVVRAHEAEGKSAAVVLIDDLYDEFNFGDHGPLAIRDFLQTAIKVWQTPPHYLLLNGRASFDPRNYLGFGHLDFVPTKIIPTTGLMTASDDWFSDFNDTGIPTIATGRFPVSTTQEAQLVAGKVSTYEGESTNGPWTSQALVVADTPDTENFTKYSQVVQAQLPSSIQATDVFLSDMSVPEAQQAILNGINSGQVLVNYSGHGSEDEWSGDDLFDSTEASTLTNGTSLPVFLIMDCLNGFFQDVYEEPLAVSLMLAPNGGAVAVLASSGLNQATPQTILDKLVVQGAMGQSHLALGDAIVKAKSGITEMAVRKTYNLLGDPAMQIKLPVASPGR